MQLYELSKEICDYLLPKEIMITAQYLPVILDSLRDASEWKLALFNVRMGGGQKGLHSSFSPVTSTNVRISPQNFLIFSFNPFATLIYNVKAIRDAGPKLLNLNQDYPSKKWFFWSNSNKIRL